MRKVYVTPAELASIQKLFGECASYGPTFDSAGWVVGLACLFGCSVEELRERAGSFPDGKLTEVVVCEEPHERWDP